VLRRPWWPREAEVPWLSERRRTAAGRCNGCDDDGTEAQKCHVPILPAFAQEPFNSTAMMCNSASPTFFTKCGCNGPDHNALPIAGFICLARIEDDVAVGVMPNEIAPAQHVQHGGPAVGVDRRAFARSEACVEHPDPFVFEQHVMVMRGRLHRIQHIGLYEGPTRNVVTLADHAATPLTRNMEHNDTLCPRRKRRTSVSASRHALNRLRIFATFGVPQLLAVPLFQDPGPTQGESTEQRQDLAHRMRAQLPPGCRDRLT